MKFGDRMNRNVVRCLYIGTANCRRNVAQTAAETSSKLPTDTGVREDVAQTAAETSPKLPSKLPTDTGARGRRPPKLPPKRRPNCRQTSKRRFNYQTTFRHQTTFSRQKRHLGTKTKLPKRRLGTKTAV